MDDMRPLGKLFPSFTSTKWPDGTVSKVVWMFSARDIMITERTPELAITQHMKSFKIFNLDKKHEKIKNNP